MVPTSVSRFTTTDVVEVESGNAAVPAFEADSDHPVSTLFLSTTKDTVVIAEHSPAEPDPSRKIFSCDGFLLKLKSAPLI